MTTVKASPSKISPTRPSSFLYMMSGRNTQIVVRVEAEIASIISCEPRMAAGIGLVPFSLYVKMFSRMTIELSTSMPTPSVRPASVMMFSVIPLKYMIPSVTTREIGMVSPMMMVLRKLRRKMNRMMTARRAPDSALPETSSTERWMMSVVFMVSLIVMSAGASFSMSAILALTARAVLTELVPLCFWMDIWTLGTPLK